MYARSLPFPQLASSSSSRSYEIERGVRLQIRLVSVALFPCACGFFIHIDLSSLSMLEQVDLLSVGVSMAWRTPSQPLLASI